MKRDFTQGMRHGIPIMLGYLSVSFGVGLLAAQNGFSVLSATLLSLTNLTSAGQTAGILTIGAGGAVWQVIAQLILTQLVINLRYSLMGLSLSQKLAPSFTTPHRLAASYGITDEIFAVAYARPRPITPAYLYGLIAVSVLGWTFGTFLGAFAGELLPPSVSDAMGILLYGMFIAIVVPPAKQNHRILLVVLAAIVCNVICHFLLPAIPDSVAVILSAVIAAALGALFFREEATA